MISSDFFSFYLTLKYDIDGFVYKLIYLKVGL